MINKFKKIVFLILIFYSSVLIADLNPKKLPDNYFSISNSTLDENLPKNKDTVILLKDRVRKLIGRISNKENINSQNRDTLFESIRKNGSNTSASCGHIAFAYEQILHDHKINAHLISFYYVNNESINGHTATEVSLDNKNWFIVDPHAGTVWQNKNIEWANTVQLGCQAVCYKNNFNNWQYSPSFSGNESYQAETLNHTLLYMALDKNRYSEIISAIGILKPNYFENVIALQELILFKNTIFDEKRQQDLIKLLKNGNGLTPETKITYYDQQSCGCTEISQKNA